VVFKIAISDVYSMTHCYGLILAVLVANDDDSVDDDSVDDDSVDDESEHQ
jgi:hypothetical protein